MWQKCSVALEGHRCGTDQMCLQPRSRKLCLSGSPWPLITNNPHWWKVLSQEENGKSLSKATLTVAKICNVSFLWWFGAHFNKPEKSENKSLWSDDINYVWVPVEYSSIRSLWNTRECFFGDTAILLLLGLGPSWSLIGRLCVNLEEAPLGDAAPRVHDLAGKARAGS